jgi:predicted transcriptional regulator
VSQKKISVPMQVLALRLTAEEKARLQEIADARRVTLSWVLREAARMYADDAAGWMKEHQAKEGRNDALTRLA